MGRLTLNPLAHLDIWGTLMLFIAHIGWAKPVPVNPLYFKNPKKDLLWVSLAGPVSNIILAIVFGFMYHILNFNDLNTSTTKILHDMIVFAVLINFILAFFNIVPIPPLDGSKILAGIIPRQYESMFNEFMKYGHFVLLGLIVLSFAFHVPVFGFVFEIARFLTAVVLG
jgi:Zn-dependent protease